MSETQSLKDWKEIPLQYVCELNPSVDFEESNDDDELTFLPMDHVKKGFFIPNSVKFSNYAASYNNFEEGDILLAKVTPCFENGNIAIAKNLIGKKGFGSSELFVLRPKRVNQKYLFYYFQSSLFMNEGIASMTGAGGLKRVSPEVLRKHHIYLPPQDVQMKIVNYLDNETQKIDALIEAKKELLELLSEKRKAMISHVVTKGLNPDVKLKDSGISWLGKIPEHWEVERVVWHFRERDDRNRPDLPLLQVSIHNGVQIRRLSDDKINQKADDYNIYKVASRNDISFNKMRMWQGAVGTVPCDGLVSPDYVVAEPITEMVSEYYGILFKTSRFSDESGARSHGIVWDRLRLYWEEFKDITVPVPPFKEQKNIVEYLHLKLGKIDELIKATKNTISLLQERRSALITAAVTGELEEASL